MNDKALLHRQVVGLKGLIVSLKSVFGEQQLLTSGNVRYFFIARINQVFNRCVGAVIIILHHFRCFDRTDNPVEKRYRQAIIDYF